MKDPRELSHGELATIIGRIQHILYVDSDDGTIAPNKDWNGADVCQDLAAILDEYGLVPTSFNPTDSG